MMTDILYDYFRGASGFALMVIGLGFYFEPEHYRIRIASGSFFVAVGASLVLSWSSNFGLLPLALDNFLIICIVLTASMSVFEIQLYILGDEARHGLRRLVYCAAVSWSAFLWLLPFLDTIFNVPILLVSIEDGRSLALFQSITFSGLYVLPIATGLACIHMGRCKISDIPAKSRYLRSLSAMLFSMVFVLALITITFVIRSLVLYRISQILFQLLILGWYLHLKAVPQILTMARKEIGREHKRKTHMDSEEAEVIKEKLHTLEIGEHIFTHASLNPAMLASALGIPVYKLILYMSQYRGSTFVEWLHAARIDHARTLLATPEISGVYEAAAASGYSKVSIFKSQFKRRVGMTPETYRIKKLASPDRPKRKVPERV